MCGCSLKELESIDLAAGGYTVEVIDGDNSLLDENGILGRRC
jgi:hypothetical protein